MKKFELYALFFIIIASSIAATYTGTKPSDLNLSTPTEGNTKVSEFNNSDREIKTVIVNLENITTVTGTYTVAGTQTGILGSSTTAFTISFPAASTLAIGTITKRYMIKNINSGTITLNLTVDGVGSPTVAGSQTFKLFTNGTSWFEDRVGRAAVASNADLLDNLDSTYFTNATNISTGTVALARIPGTLTGKSADLLDEQTGSYYTNASNLDSGSIPLARIPTTLTGKDADTIDTINGASIVQTSRTISTTAPLAGGGALSGDLTLSMPLATSGQNGYISSADWSTFNNKLATSRTITATTPLTIAGVASADLSADRTIAMATATASQDGFMKKEDFQTFNNKANIVAGSGITSSNSTGTTTITNNGVLQIVAGTGITITGNGTGTPTITAVGSTTSGGWLDTGTATEATAGYPVIVHGTLTVDTAYGVTGLLDRDIPGSITLDNITQITTRNYADLTGTSTISPTTATITTAVITDLTATSGTITNLYGVGFDDITGSATASQLPLISALSGSLTSAQSPPVLRLPGTTTEQSAGAFGQLYVQSSLVSPGPGFGTLITDSLVSYYKLENLNDNFGSNNLTNFGTTTFVAGKYGNCATFNGTNQYLRASLLSTQTTNISIFAWVYIPTTSEARPFFNNGVEDADTNGYGLVVGGNNGVTSGNKLHAHVHTVAWLDFSLTIGTGWHHVGMTRGTDTWTGYVDKVAGTATFTNNPVAPTGNFTIGRNVGGTNPYYNDKIDDVVFYNKQLSAGEIIELYNNTWSEGYTQYSAKYKDPVNGQKMLEVLTTGTDNTKASYIYLVATTTVFGLGTNTAITATSTAYKGWFDGAVRATAFNVASTEKIKENIKDINIMPALLDAEAEAKQKYIADKKAAWFAVNQNKYGYIGTDTVAYVDTKKMEVDYVNYVELEWASDLNQGTYTSNIQKAYEESFWQKFNSIKSKSWNPKDKPNLTRKGFVVEGSPDEIKGDDKETIDPMALIAYTKVALQSLKDDSERQVVEIGSLTAALENQKVVYNEEVDNLYKLINAIIVAVLAVGGVSGWSTMRTKRKGP